jgi:hypothetical protein
MTKTTQHQHKINLFIQGSDGKLQLIASVWGRFKSEHISFFCKLRKKAQFYSYQDQIYKITRSFVERDYNVIWGTPTEECI